jgi:hypothetical protein
VQHTAVSITPALMLAFTAVTLGVRLRGRADSNLPLIYFAFVFGYSLLFPGQLTAKIVYAGVVVCLFLRFEFMSGWLRWLMLAAEAVVLVYLGWEFYDQIWG